jgi:hypothetical protein
MAPECGRPCTAAQMLDCGKCGFVGYISDLVPPRMYSCEEGKNAICERMREWHRERTSTLGDVLTERLHTNTEASSASSHIATADQKQRHPATGLSTTACPSAVSSSDTSLHQPPLPRSSSPGGITPPHAVEHGDEAMPLSISLPNTKTPLWRNASSSRCILSPDKTEESTTATKPWDRVWATGAGMHLTCI